MVFFQTKKFQYVQILEEIQMENVDIFGNLVRPFGLFYCRFGNLVILWYPRFGILYKEKSGSPRSSPSFAD
jgi:hypothetical protein